MMGQATQTALLLGISAEACGAIRRVLGGAAALDVETPSSVDDALARVARDPTVGAVVIGPEEPQKVAAAKQFARADRELHVLLVASPKELQGLRETLRVAPFVGPRTTLHSDDALLGLGAEVRRAVEQTLRRRHHKRALRAISAQVGSAIALAGRPSAVLDSLLEVAPVGIVELDGEVRAVRLNPEASRLLGGISSDALAGPFPAALRAEGLSALLSEASKVDGVAKGVLERTGGDATEYLQAAAVKLPEEAAGRSGFLVVLQDITAQVRLQSEREALLHELEAAVRLRDEFLSVASHELRTPLTSVLGWVQMLRTGTVAPEKFSHGLEVIERNARAQARLIEDLLDVSRIVTRGLELVPEPLDLANLVRQVAESIAPAADGKGVRLIFDLDAPVGPVAGDSSRLQQVVWNLLTNAVKFTPPGGSVAVVLKRAGPLAELSVQDTGEGISPDFLPHVFERFRQADATSTRRHGGLGLGLYIVRQIVELHGGRVMVESEGPNRGATFAVFLPRAVGRADRAENARS